jgi:hypothetical protein
MAKCARKKKPWVCTLEKGHPGPYHVDEVQGNSAWVDEALPEPEFPFPEGIAYLGEPDHPEAV